MRSVRLKFTCKSKLERTKHTLNGWGLQPPSPFMCVTEIIFRNIMQMKSGFYTPPDRLRQDMHMHMTAAVTVTLTLRLCMITKG